MKTQLKPPRNLCHRSCKSPYLKKKMKCWSFQFQVGASISVPKKKKIRWQIVKKNKCCSVQKWQSAKSHILFRANKTNQGLSWDMNGRDPPGAPSPTQPAQNQLWSSTSAFVVGNVRNTIKDVNCQLPIFPGMLPSFLFPTAAAGCTRYPQLPRGK